jgi:hypothetical protein
MATVPKPQSGTAHDRRMNFQQKGSSPYIDPRGDDRARGQKTRGGCRPPPGFRALRISRVRSLFRGVFLEKSRRRSANATTQITKLLLTPCAAKAHCSFSVRGRAPMFICDRRRSKERRRSRKIEPVHSASTPCRPRRLSSASAGTTTGSEDDTQTLLLPWSARF